ncbi:histone demethylase [Aureococcus anophagefferens]|nr:histone demethylase [Aureococcus anophagefferens]
MALLQDAMETRDAVALAHAWACAAPGDDAERLGDALSLAVLGGLDGAAAGDIGARAAVRLRALDAPADDDGGDGGCAAVLGALARASARRRRRARRSARSARRSARRSRGRCRTRSRTRRPRRCSARRGAAPARGAVEAPAALARAGRLLASPREPARRLAALFATVDGLERDAAATEAYAAAAASSSATRRSGGDWERNARVRVLRVGCSVNLYATPPGAQALDARYDDHCVFVVQLRGRKRWRLYGPALECPTLHEATLPPPPELLRRGADHAVALAPGDVLYVPRGVYHAATACEDAGSDSAHVTVGVDLDPALTWRGAFHAALRDAAVATHACLRRAAETSPALRRACLPALMDAAPGPTAAAVKSAAAAALGPAARGRRRSAPRTTSRPRGLAVPRGAIAVGAADFADAARAVEGAVVDAAVFASRRAVARAVLDESAALSAFYRVLGGGA